MLQPDQAKAWQVKQMLGSRFAEKEKLGKKQHFVPRLLLRNFSSDVNHKLINIFLFSTNSVKENCGLYEQAQKHNLYGSDQNLEKAFEIMESHFSSSIKKLLNEDLILSQEQDAWLKVFIVFQRNRTPMAVERYNQSMNAMLQNIASHDEKLKKYEGKYDISLSNPYHFLFKISGDMAKYIADLKLGLIKCRDGKSFVIGEHPVVILNPFLKYKNWNGSKQGLGVKGTIIILPISEKYCIVLYDDIRYKFRNFKKIIEINDKDLEQLNYCQFLQSYCCIYFGSNQTQEQLSRFSTESEEYRSSDKSKLDIYKGSESKKARVKSELMRIGNKELPILQDFNFISLLHRTMDEPLGPTLDIRREVLKVLDDTNKKA